MLVGWGTKRELEHGTFGWTRVLADTEVPEGAAWMLAFVALEPCEGRVYFDDIRLNLVEPKPPSAAAPSAEPPSVTMPALLRKSRRGTVMERLLDSRDLSGARRSCLRSVAAATL